MPTPTQRTVTTWAGITLLLALVAAVMIATTPDDAGANIGAGMVLLVVLVTSFVTAVLLVNTRERGARLAAAVATLAWVAYFSLAVDDTGPRWLALSLIAVAVLAPAAWVGRQLRESRRRA